MVYRKAVPVQQARKLVDATLAKARAIEAWEDAIVEALRAGASIREVAVLAACSHGNVQTIAKRNGWPDAAEKKRVADEAAQRAEWKAQLDHYLEHGRLPGEE